MNYTITIRGPQMNGLIEQAVNFVNDRKGVITNSLNWIEAEPGTVKLNGQPKLVFCLTLFYIIPAAEPRPQELQPEAAQESA